MPKFIKELNAFLFFVKKTSGVLNNKVQLAVVQVRFQIS